MKKLVIISQYFLPEMGAPQNRLFELATELQNFNWNVEVVTALPNYPKGKIFDGYRGKFSMSETISNLRVHRYWLYPSKSSRALPRIASMLSFSFTAMCAALKVRRFQPDYVLLESPPLTLGITGWVLARFAGAKFILNVSDLWPLSAKELGAISEGFLYQMLEYVERFLYKRADICTGQSQEIVDYIRARKSGRVMLLRNGVDTSRFTPSGRSTRTYKIIYAGLLGVAQGILQICKSINFRHHGLEFHIYGSGNELEVIQDFLKNNSDRGIVYMGVIDRKDIPATLTEYDAALVVLIKNIFGAVPSKIYEAMAAGLPILFSGEGEGAEIVRQNAVGWVNAPTDMSALRNNLQRVHNLSADELANMRRNARQIAKEKFDRRKQITQFHKSLMENTGL